MDIDFWVVQENIGDCDTGFFLVVSLIGRGGAQHVICVRRDLDIVLKIKGP
jgi:hypothetical protein